MSGDRPFLLHAEIERVARADPGRVAVSHGSRSLTYGELDAQAGRVAANLRGQGVGPDAVVGVCVRRSLELVVALLAVLKAGGAYLALDPEHPSERLSDLLRRSHAACLVVDPAQASALWLDGRTVVVGDETWRRGAAPAAPAARPSPEHLATVIYTSGSTGVPKAAMIPHRSIRGYRDVPGIRFDGSQTFLQYSAVSWDALVVELWTPLLTGGRCVLYPHPRVTPAGLREVVAAEAVTTLAISPSFLDVLLEVAPGALAPVRQLLVGGEELLQATVRRALARHPGMTILNGYGPVECTVYSTGFVIRDPAVLPRDDHAVPIGAAVGDRDVHVLDERGERVPPGGRGEIHVGGPAVARGYLDAPALTAASFVPDPFAAEPGARMYRTGDLADVLYDGALRFAGRDDDQVKILGYRVELGEVDAVLRAHPAVGEAAAVAVTTASGARELRAFVVPAAAQPAPAALAATLRADLAGGVPAHLVPSRLEVVTSLPKTATGKIDRRALTRASGGRGARGEPAALAAQVWTETLGQAVDDDTDFFAAGGTSLMATRIISTLAAGCDVDLPLRVLFDAPRFADFVASLRARCPPPRAVAVEARRTT